MQRFQIKQSKKEYYTSHSGLALIGLALNRYTCLKKELRALAKRHRDSDDGADSRLRRSTGFGQE